MNIALVDDDEFQIEQLYTFLTKQLGGKFTCDRYTNGESFLQGFTSGSYDLIILDIFMDELTGIDTAKKIREKDASVRLVFSTTSNEFASESYEVNACYYLCKPLDSDKVAQMLDRINIDALENMRTITLPDGTSLILRTVIYADSNGHYINFHLTSGETMETRITFSQLEAMLCAYPFFFSPTKGILVNFHEVSRLKDNTLQMVDGSIIPVSRRKGKAVTDAYSAFRFSKLRKEDLY